MNTISAGQNNLFWDYQKTSEDKNDVLPDIKYL